MGGVSLTAVNVYGRLQLGLSNFETSAMVAILSIGIALGSVVVGRMSRGKVRLGLVTPGMIGLVVCMVSVLLVPAHEPTPEEIARFAELMFELLAISRHSKVPG